MTQARSQLVDPSITPYYHCICRCVRRAFLCGHDDLTGRSYEHRKQWLVERLGVVSRAFAIEVCAYAVMSNHYHLVVRINRKMAEQWSDDEVIERWERLYSLPRVIENYRNGQPTGPAAKHKMCQCVDLLRQPSNQDTHHLINTHVFLFPCHPAHSRQRDKRQVMGVSVSTRTRSSKYHLTHRMGVFVCCMLPPGLS